MTFKYHLLIHRLYVTSRSTAQASQFLQARENSVYAQILKNNMADDSFNSSIIYTIPVSDKKLAFFGAKNSVLEKMKKMQNCQVTPNQDCM